MNALAPARSLRSRRHAPRRFYKEHVAALGLKPRNVKERLDRRDRFVAAYPDLEDWFAAPLWQRVGRFPGQDRPADELSYRVRPYLLYLALAGYAWIDWEWLLGIQYLGTTMAAAQLGIDLGVDDLHRDAVRLGYVGGAVRSQLYWGLARLVLHRGDTDVASIGEDDVAALEAAIAGFDRHRDIAELHGSAEAFRRQAVQYQSQLHLLRVVLYHRGQLPEVPRKGYTTVDRRPRGSSKMEAVLARYLAARALTDRPATVKNAETGIRRFMTWITAAHPSVDSFAQVTRAQVMQYSAALAEQPSSRTGVPLAVATRLKRLSDLSVFFQDTAAWGWPDTPAHPLLGRGDLPKALQRVPRYIAAEELERLMVAVGQLVCPYQRTALLVARWCGARRDEIRRLEIDCLDNYPDGTPRLRIPAGKTRRERIVPLHDQAADAIRELRSGREHERSLVDPYSATPVRYLFLRHGKLASHQYLFVASLRQACTLAGLVDAHGRATVTAHRFRHSVGTQLAERGAHLATIMAILGHNSATMSMTYSRISDPVVLADYQAVLRPGTTLAGPAADALRSGALTDSAVQWLATNFFKTELELGHCLRLPQEGPCQCDLYLSCAKFVTTSAYAPRLRQRRTVEIALAADADNRGWTREVERHRCTLSRLDALLAELDEPLDETTDKHPGLHSREDPHTDHQKKAK